MKSRHNVLEIKPERDSPVEELLSPGSEPLSLVGQCVGSRHPSLRGRARVRWQDAGGTAREEWLPTLMGTVVREADRVLLLHPDNWDEPVIVGVVDGFARRPEAPELPGPTIAVNRDEVVSLSTADGRPLLEVRQTESGPAVRIVNEDVHLEVPGRLRIDAKQLELKAKQGGVEIEACDDVRLRGEVIHLN